MLVEGLSHGGAGVGDAQQRLTLAEDRVHELTQIGVCHDGHEGVQRLLRVRGSGKGQGWGQG